MSPENQRKISGIINGFRNLYIGNNPRNRHSESVQVEQNSDSLPIANPSIFPTDFPEVLQIFDFHLDSVRADPGRLNSVRESRSFKLCLQCLAYRISVCQFEINDDASFLKHSRELARLNFFPRQNKAEISYSEKRIKYHQAEMSDLTDMLDHACRLGLDRAVSDVTQACQLNADIRRLWCLSEQETDSGRWDLVLRHTLESVNLLSERNKVWPSWPDLEETRQKIMEPTELYGYEDHHGTELLILLHLLQISYNFLPAHNYNVREYVKLHFHQLDQELIQLTRFITNQAEADPCAHDFGMFMSAIDDTAFCEMSIRWLCYYRPPLPTHRFGLRLYRLCLNMGERDLADMAMETRYTDDQDQQKVLYLLYQILTKIRINSIQPTEPHLNDQNDVTNDDKVGANITEAEGTLQDEAWWVKVFKRRNGSVQSLQEDGATRSACSSGATTREPTSSFLRKCSSMKKERTITVEKPDPWTENLEVARAFTTNNSIRDCDTYSINFSYITAQTTNPIILNWKESSGDRERKVNIAAGVAYHCGVLAYHPVQDVWSVKSDMCRISGPLIVQQAGGTCVPFVGDCGEWLVDDSYIFKIHKSLSENALREYFADVRTQSTALWYVNRFRELTHDQFGILDMLHSDLIIVYQDCQRDTILELMTREMHYRPGSAVKFEKYTSNTSYRNKRVNTKVLEAFSHFTHQDSEGTVMVADLQGWVVWDDVRDSIRYTLTDPVIHCPGYLYRFGGTNRDHEGIRQFFQHVHPTCNHICDSLNLTRPEESRVKPQSELDGTGLVKPERRSVPVLLPRLPPSNHAFTI